MFKITFFDHQLKKWVELNKNFNLEEKRKIIEGFFLAYHKTVVKTSTSIHTKQELIKTKDGHNLIKVQANCNADISVLQTDFKKGITFSPYLESLDDFCEKVNIAFDRKYEETHEKVQANFEFL